MSRNWFRWIPAAAVPAAVAVGLVVSGASAVPPPPPASAEQVVALVASHRAQQFSGDVEQTTDLGLPAIPSQALDATGGSSAGQAAAVLGLLTTAHSGRVYADGPTRLRVQVMDQLAERDVIRNGSTAWTWDSKAARATRTTLPAPTPRAAPTPDAALTPDTLARRVLAAAGPSTAVTLGDPVIVAGHSAYTLVLTPRTSGTLVASVRIAVESATGLPLAVDVHARGQVDPAFHLAMTSVDLRAPDPSVFAFTPPRGATVTQEHLPAAPHRPTTGTSAKRTAAPAGWDAVVTLPADRVPADLLRSPLVAQLSTPVGGGRLLSSSLVNVLVTTDGRLLAGAVPVSTLEAAAR
ncbi:membrane protein [Tersicoccus solisilvae]|uniref:Membrane protein n=1 Tax=Tersicoccus solisilvae TaxID=1882339 RepID=A0ABQ1PQ13_9MICC|nr:DUF2092 domain-containing protein [Tersicoccus solisilvae]GGD00924.1 membrane protein [Tersicoccus solisilvae]